MLLLLLAQVRWQAQQQPVDPAIGSNLLQYGPLGVFAFALLVAVAVMWRQLIATANAERQRADRLEAELLALHKLMTGEYSGNLVRATEALREVSMQRHRDRDRGDR